MTPPRFYDITRPVQVGMPVWPGDTEYTFALGWSIAQGESVNVGTVTMSVHTGTHVDAPFHFDNAAPGIGELDLTPYVGPAWVVDVQGLDSIPWSALENIPFAEVPRLLLKTGSWSDPTRFPESVPTLAPGVAERLGEARVRLLGVDVPSVDALESKELPVHHALNRAGIRILESVDLQEVPSGLYHLTALPLRLMGADGSPVRAILTQ